MPGVVGDHQLSPCIVTTRLGSTAGSVLIRERRHPEALSSTAPTGCAQLMAADRTPLPIEEAAPGEQSSAIIIKPILQQKPFPRCGELYRTGTYRRRNPRRGRDDNLRVTEFSPPDTWRAEARARARRFRQQLSCRYLRGHVAPRPPRRARASLTSRNEPLGRRPRHRRRALGGWGGWGGGGPLRGGGRRWGGGPGRGACAGGGRWYGDGGVGEGGYGGGGGGGGGGGVRGGGGGGGGGGWRSRARRQGRRETLSRAHRGGGRRKMEQAGSV